jgi:hypothetical protein
MLGWECYVELGRLSGCRENSMGERANDRKHNGKTNPDNYV